MCRESSETYQRGSPQRACTIGHSFLAVALAPAVFLDSRMSLLEDYTRRGNMLLRLVYRLLVVAAVFVLLSGCAILIAQQRQSHTTRSPVAETSKCAFLRRELHRIAGDAQDFVDQAPLSKIQNPDELAAANATLGDWASYVSASEVFAAKETILRLDLAACQRGMALSDTSRLTEINSARAFQVRRALRRWEEVAGDAGKDVESSIAARISDIYETEAKSFYNSGISSFGDKDVGKDYSELPALIQNSGLDQGTKEFYNTAVQFLRYEEAGQLANVLRGLDPEHGLNYAYVLRKSVEPRVVAASNKKAQLANELLTERTGQVETYAVALVLAFILLFLLWLWVDRARAKYRAFRTGTKRSPFWFGNAEWVFWEPGETVVLLEHKQLIPMKDPRGGYCAISSWRGQEYKGRVSYKTQFSTWTSDPILTSDGLAVNLKLGVWWKIVEAQQYVSAISSEYHEGTEHHSENLTEAAEVWIQKLTAGTLREEVNKLPAEKLISPYVQAYLQVRRGPEGELLSTSREIPNFSEQLGEAQKHLHEKLVPYGIAIERLEVQELVLPHVYQEKLERVRVAFLEPSESRALTDAQVIALKGLESVLGPETVRLIEVLKHVDMSNMAANPFSAMMPIVQPVIQTVQQQAERALPPDGALPKRIAAAADEKDS